MNYFTRTQTKVFVPENATFGLLDPTNSIGFHLEDGLDVSDIDLTQSALDSRIVFTRASQVAYYNNDKLEMAGQDVWPLERVNGVVMGRHQPEKPATNFQLQMKGDLGYIFTNDNQSNLNYFLYRQAANYTPTPGLYGNCAGVASTLINWALYNSNTSTWIKTTTDMKLDNSWKRTVQNFVVNSPTLVRAYIARLDTSNYIYSNAQVPAGTYTTSFYATKTNGKILTGYVQFEEGLIATSPIFSEDTAKSRAAAYARIQTQGQTGCTLHYNDGSTLPLTFVAGENFHQLPFSTVDWATKFITRISYNT